MKVRLLGKIKPKILKRCQVLTHWSGDGVQLSVLYVSGSQKEEWAPGNATRSTSVFSAPELLSPWGHSPHILSLGRLLLYDAVDCSPPGCSVHGTLQARILEWVAVPFSRGSSRPRDRTLISYISCLAGSLLPLVPPGKPLPAQAPTKHGSGREQSVVATLQLLNAISDVEKHVFLFAI